jgi:carboxymethylenebutenolidase
MLLGVFALALPLAAVAVTRNAAAVGQQALPAGADDAVARLNASPRHGEWVTVRSGTDSIRAWVVHPERSDAAPVVLVVHEIFGLSNWVRAVADQLAAEGFIAIAPDLLTMQNVPQTESGEADPQQARQVIGTIPRETVNRYLTAVAGYGMGLPSARRSYGIVGFCWGGTTSFEHAIAAPDLDAAVVYYGGLQDPARVTAIQAPVLGNYGGADNRVNATIPAAEQAMQAAGKRYEPHIYDGAGHGFLRQQTNEANQTATRQAWPRTVAFFKQHLGG